MSRFHTATIWCDNGYSWKTSINSKCTEEEVVDYFMGNYANTTPYSDDNEDGEMSRVVAVMVRLNTH